MPRKGQAYPVDDGLRERIERALEKRGWSHADFARELQVGRSTVHLLMKRNDEGGELRQSPLVPDVHMLFGWSPPMPASLEEEASEAVEMLKQMSPVERARWMERGQAILDEKKRRE